MNPLIQVTAIPFKPALRIAFVFVILPWHSFLRQQLPSVRGACGGNQAVCWATRVPASGLMHVCIDFKIEFEWHVIMALSIYTPRTSGCMEHEPFQKGMNADRLSSTPSRDASESVVPVKGVYRIEKLLLFAGKWVDKRSAATSTTQTSFISCSSIIFVLTTNCKIDLRASKSQQMRALPFDAPLKGRIGQLMAFGHFTPSEERLIMMDCLDKFAMMWQTGQGLSCLVKTQHYRRITYRPEVVDGALERRRLLVKELGVRAFMQAALDITSTAVLEAIDDLPEGTHVAIGFDAEADRALTFTS